MASPTAELEVLLQDMLSLKPPGVSGSKITKATKLCSDNVKSESVLVQKMYTHFKKAPATYKLGALYVVDSVTRRWLEHAKAEGQVINGQAKDGTFASAVHRITDLMPIMISDIIASAPAAQTEKIKKLFDIWEKGQTFPPSLIKDFREKLATPAPMQDSTTPKNSPPPELIATYEHDKTEPAKPVLPNSSAIMEALANMARQNSVTRAAGGSLEPFTANTTVPAPTSLSTTPTAGYPNNTPYGAPPPVAAPNMYGYSAVPAATNPGMPAVPFGLPGQTMTPASSLSSTTPNPLAQLFGMMPSATPPGPSPLAPQASVPPGTTGTLDPNAQRQLYIIQTLISQGVPYEQIPALMQTMSAVLPPAAAAPGHPPFPGPNPTIPSSSWPNAHTSAPLGSFSAESSARNALRSPTYRDRSRSRSPGRRAWSSLNDASRDGNDRSRYDDYRRGDMERDSRRGDYRQRSPVGRGRSSTPPSARPTEKFIEYDRSLPHDHIKVYSRTLFVGGVTCPESELRSIFARHGEVQTCIVNRDKRHAFVKMTNRKDAEAAKAAMDRHRGSDFSLRTRWGVGFGPRDCSDFNNGPNATGTSIIPIHKLTDADRKWMLTAEFGGSGGKPIEHGLVVEEPDIEIGAGVSSKAISRRMPTGKNAPEREEERDQSSGGWRRGASRRDDEPTTGPSAITAGTMLGFPFSFGAAAANNAGGAPGMMPYSSAPGYGLPDQSQMYRQQ